MGDKGVCLAELLESDDVKRIMKEGSIDEKQISEIAEAIDSIKKEGGKYAENVKEYRKRTAEQEAYTALREAKHIEKVDTLLKQADETGFIEKGQANKIFESLAESSDTTVKGTKYSYQKLYTALEKENNLQLEIANGEHLKTAIDPRNHKAIVMAMDLNNKGKSISHFDPAIQTLATNYNKLNKWIVKRLDDAGIIIKERADYLFRQTHDVVKISGVTADEWIGFIRDKLDVKKTFGHITDLEGQNKILDRIYNDFTEGKTSSGIGHVGKKRALHFKDGENFFAYHERFGEGTILETMQRSLNNVARMSAIEEIFGPDGARAWDKLETKVAAKVEKLHGAKAREKFMSTSIGEAGNFRNNIKQEIFGFNDHPAANLTTKVLKALQYVSAAAHLGKVAITTIVDWPTGMANYMAQTGTGFIKTQLDFLNVAHRSVLPGQQKKWAKLLGMSLDILDADRFGAFNGASGSLKKLSKFAMTITGLNFTTKMNRTIGALLFSSHLADISHLPFDKLEARMKSSLGSFNITKKDWGILQAAIEDADGISLMTAEKITDRKLKTKFLTFISHNSTISSPQPGVRTQARIHQGLSPNTTQGQILRTFLQFKSFPLEIGHVGKDIGLANPKAGATKFLEGMKDMGNLTMFGHFMTGGFVYAAASLVLKDYADGKTPRDMTKRENILEAMTRGVLPLYMQYAVDSMNGNKQSYGAGILKEMAGPTFGQIDNVFELIKAASRDPKGPGSDKWLKIINRSVKLAVRNTPGLNNPITSALGKKFFLNSLNEKANPGISAKINRKMQKDGQEYWSSFFAP